MARFTTKPARTRKPKKSKPKKPPRSGSRSNAWRNYIGGGSNAPIPW